MQITTRKIEVAARIQKAVSEGHEEIHKEFRKAKKRDAIEFVRMLSLMPRPRRTLSILQC